MSMNIKNAETEALARQVAARTGETLTGAITTALRERLQRMDAQPSEQEAEAMIAAVKAITADIAPRLKEPWASQDHGDLLYDELGLPR